MSNWQRRGVIAWVLSPIAILYVVAMKIRTEIYRMGLFQTYVFDEPIIVIGNLTVGGTGKTPLVANIVNYLKRTGFNPGIISRGYRGRTNVWPQLVTRDSNATMVGDEPVILARQTQCPVIVDPDRPRGVRQLIQSHACDVIISDDGLQHLALGRTVEIVVVDAQLGFGNNFYIPAGPLRDSKSKLDDVDFVVYNGHTPGASQWSMTVELLPAVNIRNPDQTRSLDAFSGSKVHAVAGVGNPQRFFEGLTEIGLSILEHPFPDHVSYDSSDLEFGDDYPILMTEKDAVKCEEIACERTWFVPMRVKLNDAFYELLLKQLQKDD